VARVLIVGCGCRGRGLARRLTAEGYAVRGVVYEAAGSVDAGLLAEGATIVHEASARWRIPAEVVEEDPSSYSDWVAAISAAVTRVLNASA
jgi:prephenate dehydrogenase